MRKSNLCLVMLLLSAVASSYGSAGELLADDRPQAESQEAQEGVKPEEKPAAELPQGHPPVTARPSTTDVLPALPPGSGTGASALVWDVPEGWVMQTPSSPMRRAQYRVPGPGGDGTCAVFYFGPGQGGDAMANAERWAGQFTQPDGRASKEVMKTEKLDVSGIPVLLVEVTGTFQGGMTMGGSRPEEQPDSMLLGAIAQGGDANWFFKLTGPEATLAGQRQAFQGMIRSLRRGE